MPATYSQDAPAEMPARMEPTELSSPQQVTAALAAARAHTLALVAHLSEQQLEHQHSPIMSPLVWDLAHIAAYEDLWLAHRCAGLELMRPDLAELYDAFETPRYKRGEIELLNTAQTRAYMEDVSERVARAIAERGVGDGMLHEMVVRHELQHTETMRQTLALVGLLPPGEPPRGQSAEEDEDAWIELPAGTFAMGADPEGFAYDNERPRHERATGAFQIARRPVSKASWLAFSEGGGYERREWWSDEGWAWKEQYDITHHPDAATGDRRAPVCHVGWFEADAFARAHGARLPSEAEWERAATSEQMPSTRLSPAPSASASAPGVGPAPGALLGIGQVWEWTSTHFHGYPGFEPYPYREYSQVFFGERYRVLRGGSWASSARVATRTFRNWDLPERRQIFSGVRLARDA
jgi:iron(II)-dependent oxidoreductase